MRGRTNRISNSNIEHQKQTVSEFQRIDARYPNQSSLPPMDKRGETRKTGRVDGKKRKETQWLHSIVTS
jgi:hypothetical protein